MLFSLPALPVSGPGHVRTRPRWLPFQFSNTFSGAQDHRLRDNDLPLLDRMHNNETILAVPIIDHVGIAVNSLAEARARWEAILGSGPSEEETVESEGVRVAFFGEGPGRVELLAPLHEESPIARFLARRGAGIHHVCVRVADLEAALTAAEAAGAEVISPRVRVGSGGARIAFLRPGTLDGVLLELREEPGT